MCLPQYLIIHTHKKTVVISLSSSSIEESKHLLSMGKLPHHSLEYDGIGDIIIPSELFGFLHDLYSSRKIGEEGLLYMWMNGNNISV